MEGVTETSVTEVGLARLCLSTGWFLVLGISQAEGEREQIGDLEVAFGAVNVDGCIGGQVG